MSLKPISVEFLEAGMEMDDDVYGSNQGVFVLVRKGTILTANMVKRLQEQVKVSRNVYVSEKTYGKLIKKGPPKSFSQKNIEEKTGYNKLKKSTSDILDHVRETGKVDLEKTDETVSAMSEKVKSKDIMAILQCINGVRNADEYLYTHSMNVGFINGLIAKWMGFDDGGIETLSAVGILHDVGKTKVNPEILQKPGKLTDEEFEEMKKHSDFSVEILKASGVEDPEILQGVRDHHEKTNGRGYPKGLRTEEISLYGKITAISDVYDAMVAKRVYKNEQSPFLVLEAFSRNKASDLDIKIVDLFLHKMPMELLDKRVLLSDGSVGKVVFIDVQDYANPMVNVDGEIMATGKNIKVLRMVV